MTTPPPDGPFSIEAAAIALYSQDVLLNAVAWADVDQRDRDNYRAEARRRLSLGIAVECAIDGAE